MTILVIGANGRVGRQLCELASGAGMDLRAMLRHRAEEPAFDELGITTVNGDLEGDMREAMEGCEEVVFMAGSGPHTGADRTLMVDLHGAVRAIELAEELGVKRFLMLSALRANDPLHAPEALRPYMAAKHAADRLLVGSGVPYVILAPGKFTDEEATGLVSTTPESQHDITVSRGNVAEAMLEILRHPDLVNRRIELVDGDTPVAEAFS
ncbi:SDR family oxidoreductase [Aquisalimonas sp. 2447]|uniref:SDR family oxidoreductase n=1 Tax=Aquisalimonas sp. 2447 TaxID=2740807 RepID=UPI0014327E7C|nr:SDR family oxidoreductase [Aquisalimonas sp. 2447]QIT54668.1 SDR family oxidoreductase [Aquisalimonas sp. 2447]